MTKTATAERLAPIVLGMAVVVGVVILFFVLQNQAKALNNLATKQKQSAPVTAFNVCAFGRLGSVVEQLNKIPTGLDPTARAGYEEKVEEPLINAADPISQGGCLQDNVARAVHGILKPVPTTTVPTPG